MVKNRVDPLYFHNQTIYKTQLNIPTTNNPPPSHHQMENHDSTTELCLPGFRFHPTEEELLDFYLKNTVIGKKLRFDIIGFLDIYRYDPWDLPGMAKIGEREWYFFVSRDRKHGGRPNRTTYNGFWKATGSDRHVRRLADPKVVSGFRKTLVFYQGKAPRGRKTEWVMNEYRLPDASDSSFKLENVVLCKIYRKAASMKALERRATEKEEEESRISSCVTVVNDSPVEVSSVSFPTGVFSEDATGGCVDNSLEMSLPMAGLMQEVQWGLGAYPPTPWMDGWTFSNVFL